MITLDTTPELGYWKTAELLLLAQDPANLKTIQERIGWHSDPFCAFDWREKKDGFETNRNLHWLAQQIDCRKLYGSVFAGLLKHSESKSGKTPKSLAVVAYKKTVLTWVLDHVPNLRAIACLGAQARDFVAEELLDPERASEFIRGVGSAVRLEGLYVIHLMRPGFWNRNRGGWAPTAWEQWRKIALECNFRILRQPWSWDGPG